MMDMMEKSRARLMRKIGRLGLIRHDIHLFLDINPSHQEALREYEKYDRAYNLHKEEYEKTYGPIRPGAHGGATGEARIWAWCDSPWPWEREANLHAAHDGKAESEERI